MNEITKPETPFPRDVIRGLEPSQTFIFRGYSADSIRAIVSRVRQEFQAEQRDFHTKVIDGGVQVWRLQ